MKILVLGINGVYLIREVLFVVFLAFHLAEQNKSRLMKIIFSIRFWFRRQF
jgi:hypothetical protein